MMIHPLAYVHPDAIIGENTVIEPFVMIHGDVVIGDNCWVGSHATIMDGTRMGSGCKVFPGAVVGGAPQDLKFGGEYTTLEIGNNVTIREYCTLNRGTNASQKTVVGSNVLLMAYVHIAHDCVIGDNVVMANNVNLAGHVEVGEYAILAGMCAVHQFSKIGSHVMVSGGSLVGKDVPPYVKTNNIPLAYAGVNVVGLKRRGFTQEQVHHIQDIYRILYVRNHSRKDALAIIENEIEPTPFRENILSFVKNSSRGIMKGLRKHGYDDSDE